jgi:hypothetical protein
MTLTRKPFETRRDPRGAVPADWGQKSEEGERGASESAWAGCSRSAGGMLSRKASRESRWPQSKRSEEESFGGVVGDGTGRWGQAFESGNPQLSGPQPFLQEIALVAEALDRFRFTPPDASNVGVGALVAIEDNKVLGAEVNAAGA